MGGEDAPRRSALSLPRAPASDIHFLKEHGDLGERAGGRTPRSDIPIYLGPSFHVVVGIFHYASLTSLTSLTLWINAAQMTYTNSFVYDDVRHLLTALR